MSPDREGLTLRVRLRLPCIIAGTLPTAVSLQMQPESSQRS